MELREFIRVAFFAITSALGVFGIWLVVEATVSEPLELGEPLMQKVAAILHPGIWYVLAALVFLQIGRRTPR